MSTASSHPLHVPVMPSEVLALLDPRPGQIVVDATIGGGGHALRIVERLFVNRSIAGLPTAGASGSESTGALRTVADASGSEATSGWASKLIGLDQDPSMLALARDRLKDYPVTLVHRNFEDLSLVLQELQTDRVDGILADLGFSSDQLANPERGLSFQHEGALDMRLDQTRGLPASALVQRLHERELADLFWRFGEERFSRRVARKIVATRDKAPILTTGHLAELIRGCVPRGKGGIDPATRVFQALRIAVNDELGALERLLEQAPDLLKPGGRIVIISFHSLEDRLVKRAFRNREIYEELTRKPLTPSEEEIRENPRARSAKVRGARRKA